MKRLNGQQSFSITHLFIYVLAFLLLWEWLRPIPTVSDTGHIDVFVWFAFFSAVLIYLRFPFKVTLPALFVGTIFCLNFIFTQESFFSREGGLETLRIFVSDVIYNFQLIFSWELASLTNSFRTFLLFMLLALICYLLYFWIFHTKKIFFFLLSTVIYITVLDTFTPVDASMAIIRIIVIGFFILTLLHMLKVQEEEKAIKRKSGTFISTSWMYTLIFMVLIATAVGYAAPKYEPQWSDPVPTLQRYVLGESGSGTGSINRVGYGEDDERLGGGFIQDHNTVFYAIAPDSSYWRGESKHEYTGHGWTSEPLEYESTSLFEEGNVDYYMFFDSVEVEEREVRIMMEEDVSFNHLFYPGQLINVNVGSIAFDVEVDNANMEDHLPLTFMTDANSGKITSYSRLEERVMLKEYQLYYEYPMFSLNDLRNSTGEDPERIQELYLQLPDDLPARVGELAEEIIADYDNRYDQAVAVEQFFSENDFEYETANVPIPDDGQDYVDQFLFETQYGYCDNYSTAMAVLLRSVGIPTRWVKGFTAGEEIEELGGGMNRYEISNSNAHSWVEVYFPEVGWVPFEPTQGFSNNVEFYEEEEEDLEIDVGSIEEEESDEETPDRDDLLPEFDDMLEESEEAMAPGTGGTPTSEEWFTPKNVIISIVILIMVMLFYQNQNKFQNRYFIMKYNLLGKDEKFMTAYDRLLWILENEGLPRGEGETLREYASRVDLVLSLRAMQQLTEAYEKVYYGGKEASGDWKKQKSQWEEIIKTLNKH
ncbi:MULTISPECIES: DUF4129 domain-containing transglutaminase family protein [Bacillaceae]|uniref:Transglutaminase domain-containing protein n=1 Tax=Evansella alkalicola TaxID=745819 RepID=A0ABS6JRP1_9BACI|nr:MULTISPECIES: transglutaminase domain-containing protein [Bacillaceae]MBU9721228.1 transglutaminase domain-containing protein [Bacillus alkalicola]